MGKIYLGKQVRLEGADEGQYEVLTTNNGWQWTMVFRGSLEDAKVIWNAYKSIGYKKLKETKNE